MPTVPGSPPKPRITETEYVFSIVDNVIKLDCREKPCAQSTVCRNSFTRVLTPVHGQQGYQAFIKTANDLLRVEKLRSNTIFPGKWVPRRPREMGGGGGTLFFRVLHGHCSTLTSNNSKHGRSWAVKQPVCPLERRCTVSGARLTVASAPVSTRDCPSTRRNTI